MTVEDDDFVAQCDLVCAEHCPFVRLQPHDVLRCMAFAVGWIQQIADSRVVPRQIPMSRASHVLRNAGLVLGLFGDQEPGYPANMLALTAGWQSFTQCHPLDSGFSTLATFVDVCVSFCVCSK